MGLTQLIDFDGNFLPRMEQWLSNEGFQAKGFDYSVVTVLGCQSSGKSTLLNELFGTNFAIMDASQGRQQTTKGLWLSTDKEDSTIIIDVEGTDSKERGEDRMTFEHRAALFSLALADIVIVNMWYHDLGRYTASNYGLLRTVLGVNLELFQQQDDAPKTVMMFVIRDYSEAQTPLDKLNEMIQADVRTIWRDTIKPEHLRDSSADDFFIFKTVGLVSKFSADGIFGGKCQELRSMWLKELRPKSYSRQIPADGFGMYCRSVWETILKSSELDIPSQKEMLATYRCEELKNFALTEVLPSLPAYLEKAQKGVLPMSDFSWAIKFVEQALELYDKPASRYQRSIFLKKREQLLQQLQAELQKVIEAHLTHIRHRIAGEAMTKLDFLFCYSDDSDEAQVAGSAQLQGWTKFAEITDCWREEFASKFDQASSSISLTYTAGDALHERNMHFDGSHSRQALLEALQATLLRMREKQLSAFAGVLRKRAGSSLGDLDVYLNDRDLTYKNFWNSLSDVVVTVKADLMKKLGDAWLGLQPSEDAQIERWEAYATQEVVCQLRCSLERMCEWLQNHLFTRFQQFFDQDEQGVPRQWQHLSSERIKDIYLESRDKAFDIIKVLDSVGLHVEGLLKDLPSFEKQLTAPLFTESRKQQVLTKARRQMQKACQEAQLIQATAGHATSIPWWMWGLLLAFGYNEITLILFSPMAWVLLLLGLLIGGVSYYTGNFQLPMQLFRHLVGMFASTVLSVVSALQQSPQLNPPSNSSARDLSVKKETKQEE